MSNSYFQFKHFTVHQDKCAMKVSTDACIQGAWTPVAKGVKRVLDIGTGTGLLSLMLAQRDYDIIIDAVELDERAGQQAKENVQKSGWADNINIIHSDARLYFPDYQYDMIICNPPFFNKSLLGPDGGRNTARHTSSLSYEQLLKAIGDNLGRGGYASVMLPLKEFEEWEQLLSNSGWSVNTKLYIHPGEGKEANRVVGLASRVEIGYSEEHIHIRKKDSSEYTEAFIELMKPYYLYL